MENLAKNMTDEYIYETQGSQTIMKCARTELKKKMVNETSCQIIIMNMMMSHIMRQ